MPYSSAAQRRFMHAVHPKVAAKWDAEIRQGTSRTASMKPKIKTKVQRGETVTMDTVTKRKMSKALSRDQKYAAGSAALGAGGTATGFGLMGGGVPGQKSRAILVTIKEAKGAKEKAKAAARAHRAGHFGLRENSHHTYREYKLKADERKIPKAKTKAEVFRYAREAGKIKPENPLIRSMRGARLGSNAALVGGAGLIGGGAYLRSKNKSAVAKRLQGDEGALYGLAGGGLTGAGIAGGLGHALTSQSKKWKAQAVEDLDEAGKHVPPLGARSTTRSKRSKKAADVKPALSGKAVKENPAILKPYTYKQVEAGARAHGAAANARYFAHQYGSFGRGLKRYGVPAGLAAAGVGAGVPALRARDRKVKREAVGKRGGETTVESMPERRTAEQKRLAMNTQEKASLVGGTAAMAGGTGVLLARYAEPTVAGTKAKIGRVAGEKAGKAQNWARKNPKGALATGIGLKGLGVAGLMTARNRKQEAEGVSYGIAGHKVAAGHAEKNQVKKASTNVRDYRYLPENIRSLTSYRPITRNPISPLDMYASSRQMARFMSGSGIGRRLSRPRKRDVDSMLAFNRSRQMLFSPLGRGAVQGM